LEDQGVLLGSGEIHCSYTGNVNVCYYYCSCVKIYKQEILKKVGFIIFLIPVFAIEAGEVRCKGMDPQIWLGKQRFI
jgi:hypothetical protein